MNSAVPGCDLLTSQATNVRKAQKRAAWVRQAALFTHSHSRWEVDHLTTNHLRESLGGISLAVDLLSGRFFRLLRLSDPLAKEAPSLLLQDGRLIVFRRVEAKLVLDPADPGLEFPGVSFSSSATVKAISRAALGMSMFAVRWFLES